MAKKPSIDAENAGLLSLLLGMAIGGVTGGGVRLIKHLSEQKKKKPKTSIKEAQRLAKTGEFINIPGYQSLGSLDKMRDLNEQQIADIMKIYKKEASSFYTDLFKAQSKEHGALADFNKWWSGKEKGEPTGKGWSYPIMNWLKGKKHFKEYVKGLESGNIEVTGVDAPYSAGILGDRTTGIYSTLYDMPGGKEETLERKDTEWWNPLDYDDPDWSPWESHQYREEGTEGWNLPRDAAEMYIMLQDMPELDPETGEPFYTEEVKKKKRGDTIADLVKTIIHEGGHMPGRFLGEDYQMTHTKKTLGQKAFLEGIRKSTKSSTKEQQIEAQKLLDKLLSGATQMESPYAYDDELNKIKEYSPYGKKEQGMMALLQRFLPGGKTGYK